MRPQFRSEKVLTKISQRYSPRTSHLGIATRLHTSEGAIGHVMDFIMDDKSWAICHLVVETGHRYSHKEIVISPKHIDRISYEESKVFVNVSKEAIMEAPQYHVSPLGETYGDTRNFD